MNKDSFNEAIAELLREGFEGVGPSGSTWFVEGHEAILPTIRELSSERASVCPIPGRASIGAHVRHLIFLMSLANTCHGEALPAGSWTDTWSRNEFSAEEWRAMQEELERRYLAFAEWFRTNENWVHEMGVIGPISTLPHVAFHLGAIRQLVALV
ncbi:MAG TPA: hypothetical protein VG944_11525 [Fimbriimonas sp.]|nr:hypothetical protein [Fimbriimonas sp.]